MQREISLVDLLWKSFIIKIQLSFRENKAFNYTLRVSLPKSVPLDFGLEKTFAL